MSKYTLYIDDNFHYMDEEPRSSRGDYECEDEATRAAKRIVDGSLRDLYRSGMTPQELLACYKAFGEEPWVTGRQFSAWVYAEQQCWELIVG